MKELIAALTGTEAGEEMQERLELVRHKLMYVEPAYIRVVDEQGNDRYDMAEYTEAACCVQTYNNEGARSILIVSGNLGIQGLMGNAMAYLAQNDVDVNVQLLLCDLQQYNLGEADGAVMLAEDIADMMYGGQFYYGGEGERWIRFSREV